MRPLVLAVDGGQSGIRVRHSSGAAVIEREGVSRGEGDVVAGVVRAVIQGWRDAGQPPTERVVLGLTTAPAEPPSQERLCSGIGHTLGAREVWLADDAVTTHAGALSMGWGVSITAGTGVATLALPRDGGAPRVLGGHGYLLGDEGGAFWIGREGLRAVLRAGDGRGPRTALESAAAERFGGQPDLSARIHALPRPVNDIARFAPDVLAAAEAGDEAAERVAREAVAELLLLMRAAVAIAAAPGGAGGGTPARKVPVALGGRLLAPGSVLRRRLDRAIAGSLPEATARSADGSPLDGALALGRAADPGRYRGLVTEWRRDG